MTENDGKVGYWGLYVLKENEEFSGSCSMLEQFEFEIEVWFKDSDDG